ncbi:MAG: hypothetical protein ACKVZJ_12120 [Phycisphaerales bacterium]
MGCNTLPYSERNRSWSGSTATLVAVLLMLAVLPSAATVSSPMSAAILEASLRDARLIHVQRERPNPLPGSGAITRESWRSVQAKAVAVGAVRPLDFVAPRREVDGLILGQVDDALGATAPSALTRSGVLGLPPPRA